MVVTASLESVVEEIVGPSTRNVLIALLWVGDNARSARKSTRRRKSRVLLTDHGIGSGAYGSGEFLKVSLGSARWGRAGWGDDGS